MSFIDIATLTLHRRNEMELRVDSFLEKCEHAIRNIQMLKNEARGFPAHLNCEPPELKERFLDCIKKLEEYTYLITDFNIAIDTIGPNESNVSETPVQDTRISNHQIPESQTHILQPQKLNLMDVLSETMPSTSTQYPVKKPKRHKHKSDQALIVFSSMSNSDESLLSRGDMTTKDCKTESVEKTMKKLVVNDETKASSVREWPSLPAQSVLEVDYTYPAIILGVEGTSFWITTQELSSFNNLLNELEDYYKNNKVILTMEEINSLTYCAFYDQASETYFRGLIVTDPTGDNKIAEVYRVDTGSVQHVTVDCIQPLVERFCVLPPFARCCHLAGVELPDSKEFNEKMEIFMNEHIAKCCSIEVDDNTSESLGVIVHLENGDIINDMAVAQGITNKVQSPQRRRNKVYGPPDMVADGEADDPEYEDALVAVTGYHNRDEAEICKHYKGGPEKTCFKGSRCKKKHIMMHPDGWTLDKVEVLAKCKTVPLPEPGALLKVFVTYVCHFDRLYTHILETRENDKPTAVVNKFESHKVLKPLEKDMNMPTTIQSYKKFELYPALGELVAALYPPDEQWYRARVQGHDRALRTIQVIFIDYGNVMDIKEDVIRQLPLRFADLPAQAVRCVLAGADMKTDKSCDKWVEAKAALSAMTMNKVLEARVIARNYEEITVELFDEQGYSVAEQLAVRNLIILTPFSVIEDKNTCTKLVVP